MSAQRGAWARRNETLSGCSWDHQNIWVNLQHFPHEEECDGMCGKPCLVKSELETKGLCGTEACGMIMGRQSGALLKRAKFIVWGQGGIWQAAGRLGQRPSKAWGCVSRITQPLSLSLSHLPPSALELRATVASVFLWLSKIRHPVGNRRNLSLLLWVFRFRISQLSVTADHHMHRDKHQ